MNYNLIYLKHFDTLKSFASIIKRFSLGLTYFTPYNTSSKVKEHMTENNGIATWDVEFFVKIRGYLYFILTKQKYY